MKLDLGESDSTVYIQLTMTKLCTFGNDLKKNEIMGIFCSEKYFDVKFEEKFSLVENGEENQILVR